ncbi:MAG TPA: site-2 protease family protein [bacterium]|nr:site-2 protease family protein [bacterium]
MALVDLVLFYAVFLISMTFHEAAHAWSAKRLGDATAYHGGQVSLSPWPHIRRQPFGMVILPLISLTLMGWPFGYASTPYNPYWADRQPRKAAWMALAGPAANFCLLLITALFIRVGIALQWFAIPSAISFFQITSGQGTGLLQAAAALLSMLFSMNLLLMTLNLIPLPPLDGSSAVLLLLPAAIGRRIQSILHRSIYGRIAMLLIAWHLLTPMFHRLLRLALRLLYPAVEF